MIVGLRNISVEQELQGPVQSQVDVPHGTRPDSAGRDRDYQRARGTWEALSSSSKMEGNRLSRPSGSPVGYDRENEPLGAGKTEEN